MIAITVPQIILTVFLSILGFILLLLTLIIAVRIKVHLKIQDELTLCVSFLGIKFQILPKKKKKYNLKKYTLKKIRAREEKAAIKEAEKAKKKSEKAAAKKAAKAEKKKLTKEEKAQKKASRPKITDMLSLFMELLRLLPRTFLARFHFYVAKLHIVVGSEDAAKTAITYGAITGALYPTLEFLDRHSNLHDKGADIFIDTDYTSEKMKFDCDVAFAMSIFGLLCIALKLGFTFLKEWIKIKPEEPKVNNNIEK